ncbi:MAG TPA: hypothetical protein VEK06_04150 [Myxococcota bacterium]|nr:hypothetical protein [Myxococcota bacterium]
MSIKNQSRLVIFGSVIIGVTALALIGLYFMVDKISKTKPPFMTMQTPPPGPPPALDDSVKKEKQKGLEQEGVNDVYEMPEMPAARKETPPSPSRRVSR